MKILFDRGLYPVINTTTNEFVDVCASLNEAKAKYPNAEVNLNQVKVVSNV